MTTPQRPWENTLNNNAPSFIHTSDLGITPGPMRHPAPAGRIINGAPPLPPRSTRSAMPRFSGYPGSMGGMYGGYSPYGLGGYGGYGGYGGLSSYGMRGHDFENRYVQLAEESAAPAFESIESFVRGFTAVTMMLESTYQAVHMSFRAVLSVAENMSRMKSAIFDFISALTIFKSVHYFYRKVLHMLGMVNGVDTSWKRAEQATLSGGAVQAVKTTTKSVWPLLAFLGAIVAGPTIVYKFLLPNGIPEDEDVTLVASHDFNAEQAGELSFMKGEMLQAKKSNIKSGWIMAKKGAAKGYVPSTRVRIVRKTSGAASIQPNPSANQPNPSSQPNPNLNQLNRPTSQSNPSMYQSDHTLSQTTLPMYQPNPALIQPYPVLHQSNPHTNGSESLDKVNQSMTQHFLHMYSQVNPHASQPNQPNPTIQPNPQMTQPDPLISRSNQPNPTIQPNPQITQPDPLISQSNPPNPTIQPNPQMTQPDPLISQSNPLSDHSGPATCQSNPRTTQSEPVPNVVIEPTSSSKEQIFFHNQPTAPQPSQNYEQYWTGGNPVFAPYSMPKDVDKRLNPDQVYELMSSKGTTEKDKYDNSRKVVSLISKERKNDLTVGSDQRGMTQNMSQGVSELTESGNKNDSNDNN